jgi:hypothetical protein
MPKLSWISDDELQNSVAGLLEIATTAKANVDKKFGKNVIDPFSALFEMAGFSMSHEEWINSEKARQVQKTLQNFVGEFHQNLLGHCKGWDNMNRGNIIDLHSADRKIVAEVKNKFNTVSGGKLAELYWSLEDAVTNKFSKYKDFTAYYVSIISKSPGRFNKPFTPSDKAKGQKCPAHKLVRHIDGASFYSLVTGEKDALENLFDTLPVVISEITGNSVIDSKDVKKLFKLAYG